MLWDYINKKPLLLQVGEYITEISLVNDYQEREYNGIIITDKGNEWILKNENKFFFEYKRNLDSFLEADGTLPFN